MGSSINLVSSVFKLYLLALIVEKINGAEDKQYWQDLGHAELMDSLNQKWNTNTAKNVIIFLGDGMSPETIAASRISNGGEESYLAWERFPHVGLLKTYDSDKQVPDSASTATAVFCGVKTNYGVSGVDANVKNHDCEASLKKKNQVDSIITWGQNAGKDTGFVTTTRVTHATPSALYAHTADRDWECADTMPEDAANCKDIARQLIEDKPGRDIKVIMGGGRQMLQSHVSSRDQDPIVINGTCYSTDGRDLFKDWHEDKERRNFTHTVVQNTGELLAVDADNTDFLLGIFANGYMSMDWNRKTGPKGQPSLEEMTTTAIKVLQKSKNGFVLAVEGGLIDIAHHLGHAAQALRETVRLSDAIEATLKLVDTSETLIIVTSDHGHALLFRGTSDRGANILGTIENTFFDKVPYTTLGYATGGPNNMAYEINNDTKLIRKNPVLEDTTAFTYSQQAAVITDQGKHSGVDVAVYAIGPHAHLFHSTHEQSYVAYVAAYSAKMGRYQGCMNYERSHGSNLTARSLAVFIVLLIPFFR